MTVALSAFATADLFAGAGGASEGVRRALGYDPHVAVNHSPEAIAMHRANHPGTRHFIEDVWRVDPRIAMGGRPCGLLWLSPDCRHFSRAKGSAPLSKSVRSLAWAAVRWAAKVRPRVIALENVPEFQTWGPLRDDGTPDPAKAGDTFRRWRGDLRRLGYAIEHRELVAADYGAPTTRRRFFLVARCDGEPIRWPEPTHGPGLVPYRTAAEIIDWTLPCPSIFERSRPLAEPTLRRIATGVWRYVIEAARPFIVPVTHPRDARVHSIDEPVRTVTGAHRGELALIVPTLIQTGYGERTGQAPRSLDLHRPLGTVVAGGAKHALVAAFIVNHYGGGKNGHAARGRALDEPLGTVTAQDHHALAATTFDGPDHGAEVRALLERYAPRQVSLGGAVRIEDVRDIGMRMLVPRELFRAQGFPDSYRIEIDCDGSPLTKTAQTRLAGNSVPPQLAEAIVRANLGEQREERAA